MRKALIAVIVASALFAVGAFAASFAVDSEDVASGADPVGSCATDVQITFDDTPIANIGGTWTVETATATFLNGANPATACDPFLASLSLDLDGTDAGSEPESVITVADQEISGTTTVTASFTLPAGITADEIVGASVLVDGAFLTP